MDYEKFELEIEALFEYFQRKKPRYGTVKSWFEQAEHIPNTAVSYIREWIRREFEGLPKNIGKAFNAGWYQWQASNNIGSANKVVLDGVTGGYKWHSDPDGTEYMSLLEFKRRNPEYAKKLEGIGDRFSKILKKLPSRVLYDDKVQP